MTALARECTRCAACCTSSSPRHAPVTGDDWSRLRDPERWTIWIENRAYMRMENGRCAALVIGADARCAIYEERPEICRALERGSPACEAEILRKGSPITARAAP